MLLESTNTLLKLEFLNTDVFVVSILTSASQRMYNTFTFIQSFNFSSTFQSSNSKEAFSLS